MAVRHIAIALASIAACLPAGCIRFGYTEQSSGLDSGVGGNGADRDAGGSHGMDAAAAAGGVGGGVTGGGTGGGSGAASGGGTGSGTGGGTGGGTAGGTGGGTGMDAGTGGDGGLDAGTDAGPLPDPCTDAGLPLPAAPSGPLIHRYSFAAGGSTACGSCIAAAECAEDSVGGAHGVLHVATLTPDGAVQFTGDSWVAMEPGPYVEPPNPEFVELPPHMLSGLTAVTFLIWFEWSGEFNGTFEHPRLFHFGSDGASDPNDADSFIYATPGATTSNTVRASIDNGIVNPNNTDDRIGRWTTDLGSRTPGAYCLGVSFADATHRLSATLGSIANSGVTMMMGTPPAGKLLYDLSEVQDDHNYLGRSPIAVDAPFIGTISEFRIYNTALSSAEINTLCQTPEAP